MKREDLVDYSTSALIFGAREGNGDFANELVRRMDALGVDVLEDGIFEINRNQALYLVAFPNNVLVDQAMEARTEAASVLLSRMEHAGWNAITVHGQEVTTDFLRALVVIGARDQTEFLLKTIEDITELGGFRAASDVLDAVVEHSERYPSERVYIHNRLRDHKRAHIVRYVGRCREGLEHPRQADIKQLLALIHEYLLEGVATEWFNPSVYLELHLVQFLAGAPSDAFRRELARLYPNVNEQLLDELGF